MADYTMQQQKVAKLADHIKAEIARMQEEAWPKFLELFVPFFDKYPLLESFAWHQGNDVTWNDGGPTGFCVEVDVDSMDVNGIRNDDLEYELEEAPAKELKAALKEISDLLWGFRDDDMELIFGDNVEVTVRRSEITLSEYHY